MVVFAFVLLRAMPMLCLVRGQRGHPIWCSLVEMSFSFTPNASTLTPHTLTHCERMVGRTAPMTMFFGSVEDECVIVPFAVRRARDPLGSWPTTGAPSLVVTR